ncbi:MAG: demethoxyubiquinone hydroxylase family protein [Xanthomonadales bacterium]|jgi:ubiquinone biosynthesis monooxygenase Coq7|nr:demethoxyubiquinone hydroxylase family protein [Xanthomonadales bacterium]
MKTPAPLHTLPLGPEDVRDLRSDHAGEAGAVQIYRGILAVSRNEVVRAFAREHMATERRHLAFFEAWLTPGARSHALPVWKCAGWTLGATAALFGPACVFRTIRAVESFVDDHYRAQIEVMGRDERLADLVAVLEQFREEEVAHRDDAGRRGSQGTSRAARAWEWLIGAGSVAGVAVARRL